jgi:serine/threonine-protein kinase RsbW
VQLDLAICLPQDSESVSLIRSVLTDALQRLGVDEDCIGDIRLALSEACTNVLDHAADEDEYEVRIQVDDQRCVISVINTAHGFDASQLSSALPDPTSPRGRGVAIMRAVMDQVELRSDREVGTIVQLEKTLALEPDGALARLRRSGGTRP